VPPPDDRPRTDTFADRAKREAERFRLATDSEFWICFCFRTAEATLAFTTAARTTGDRVPGASLPQAPARRDPRPRALRLLAARSTRGLNPAAILTASAAPDPLAAMPPEIGDLEQDSAAELAQLLTALNTPPDPNPVSVLDSPHWAVAWWPHRAAKEQWLTATGTDILGDKYVDGHQAAAILGISLERK
jgi:hypothetical protein